MSPILNMTRLFWSECSGLLQDYGVVEELAKPSGRFSMEQLNELFQISHTIKGNAATMLYEGITDSVKAFEKYLAFYRDQNLSAPYTEVTEKLDILIQFLSTELAKVEKGKIPDGDGTTIANRIFTEQDNSSNTAKSTELSGMEYTHFYLAPELSEKTDGKVSQIFNEKENTLETHKIRQSFLISEDEVNELSRILQETSKNTKNNAEEKLLMLYEEVSGWLHDISTEPLDNLTPKLQKIVEEMSRNLKKEIELSVTGGNIAIERNRISKVSGCLLHLLRNCADHGVESPEKRVTKGKTATGHISVNYAMTDDGDRVIIDVEDDGNGFDMELLRECALRKNLISAEEHPSSAELLKMIFLPGFTTASQNGEYSGMGVGLSAAQSCMKELCGFLTVENGKNSGVHFIAEFPYHEHTDMGEESIDDASVDCRR